MVFNEEMSMQRVEQRQRFKSAKTVFRSESFYGYLMAMPAILGFLLFTIGPLIASFVLSFSSRALREMCLEKRFT